MTRFVDYAWWQVSPAQLRAMGFSGAMRYGVPGNTKSATAPEVANLRTAGFDFGLVYETVANRAAQGFAAGAADAVAANRFADSLGYPRTCTLWYAVDFDGSAAQVQAYFDGIGSAGGRPYAPYGGVDVITGVRYPGVGWQTAAWSRHLVSARAGLLQDQFSGNYDGNRVLVADFGQWRAGATPPSPPKFAPFLVTQEEPMRADLRPSKFNGHNVYDINVVKEGEQAPQPTADGRRVTCVRSELKVRAADPADCTVQIIAKGVDLGQSGVPATGGQFKCTDNGLVSIVDISDVALIVDNDVVWA
jgi:hypothetical protein